MDGKLAQENAILLASGGRFVFKKSDSNELADSNELESRDQFTNSLRENISRILIYFKRRFKRRIKSIFERRTIFYPDATLVLRDF